MLKITVNVSKSYDKALGNCRVKNLKGTTNKIFVEIELKWSGNHIV